MEVLEPELLSMSTDDLFQHFRDLMQRVDPEQVVAKAFQIQLLPAQLQDMSFDANDLESEFLSLMRSRYLQEMDSIDLHGRKKPSYSDSPLEQWSDGSPLSAEAHVLADSRTRGPSSDEPSTEPIKRDSGPMEVTAECSDGERHKLERAFPQTLGEVKNAERWSKITREMSEDLVSELVGLKSAMDNADRCESTNNV
jgi:hypothetical protein